MLKSLVNFPLRTVFFSREEFCLDQEDMKFPSLRNLFYCLTTSFLRNNVFNLNSLLLQSPVLDQKWPVISCVFQVNDTPEIKFSFLQYWPPSTSTKFHFFLMR